MFTSCEDQRGLPGDGRDAVTPVIVAIDESRQPGLVVRRIGFGDQSMFFEISGDQPPPALVNGDFAAVAMIFPAMRSGRPIHIRGTLSASLVRNLEEFQEAWAAWRPGKYRTVPITADALEEDKPGRQRKGVFACSGGVDGTYALLRHFHKDAGRRTIAPVTAMLVHGFDIALDKTADFVIARRSCEAMLRGFNLPLCVVRTNWRETVSRDWPMDYLSGVAACLHQFAGLADFGVIGADEDYANIQLPWGSNPVTNHLLSGGAFSLYTEGGAVGRTQRVAYISSFPDAARHLRVCWEGNVPGTNCGRCEKCVRTKLNFLASGAEAPCFDRPPRFLEICALRAVNAVQRSFLADILQTAKRNRIRGAWILALRCAIARNIMAIPVRQVRDGIRALCRRRFRRGSEPEPLNRPAGRCRPQARGL